MGHPALQGGGGAALGVVIPIANGHRRKAHHRAIWITPRVVETKLPTRWMSSFPVRPIANARSSSGLLGRFRDIGVNQAKGELR